MRRTLKLLLLLGLGFMLAKDKSPDGDSDDGDPFNGPEDSEERNDRLNFNGKNASEKMSEVHDDADAESKVGRAGDTDGDGDPDLTADQSKTEDSTEVDSTVPDHATTTLDYIREHGNAPPGYGLPKWQEKQRPFKNRDEDLPTEDSDGDPITYSEFDVHPYTPGVNRGAERIVIGSDGRAWYTDDHYENFTLIDE